MLWRTRNSGSLRLLWGAFLAKVGVGSNSSNTPQNQVSKRDHQLPGSYNTKNNNLAGREIPLRQRFEELVLQNCQISSYRLLIGKEIGTVFYLPFFFLRREVIWQFFYQITMGIKYTSFDPAILYLRNMLSDTFWRMYEDKMWQAH